MSTQNIILCSPDQYADDGLNDVFFIVNPCACDTGDCECDCRLIPIEDVIVNGVSQGPISSYYYEVSDPCEKTDIEVIFGKCPEYCIEFCCGADESQGISGEKIVCFDHKPDDQEIVQAIEDECGEGHSVTDDCIEFCIDWEYTFSWECQNGMGACSPGSISDSGEDCYDEMPSQTDLDDKKTEIKKIIDDKKQQLKMCEPCDYEEDIIIRIRIRTSKKVRCCDGRVFNSVEEATAAGCEKMQISVIDHFIKVEPSIPLSDITYVVNIDDNIPHITLPTGGVGDIIVRPSIGMKICPDGTLLRWSIDCNEDEPPCECGREIEVVVTGCAEWNNPVNSQIISNTIGGTNVVNIVAAGGNTTNNSKFKVEKSSYVVISAINSRVVNNCCLRSITINGTKILNPSEMTSYIVTDGTDNTCDPIKIDIVFGNCPCCGTPPTNCDCYLIIPVNSISNRITFIETPNLTINTIIKGNRTDLGAIGIIGKVTSPNEITFDQGITITTMPTQPNCVIICNGDTILDWNFNFTPQCCIGILPPCNCIYRNSGMNIPSTPNNKVINFMPPLTIQGQPAIQGTMQLYASQSDITPYGTIDNNQLTLQGYNISPPTPPNQPSLCLEVCPSRVNVISMMNIAIAPDV